MSRATGWHHRIAIASVVTYSALREFHILYYSFTIFHGTCSWFVRCDQYSLDVLTKYPNVHCSVFSDMIEYPALAGEFRAVVAEKFNAIEVAWCQGSWDAVLFVDADVVFTSEVISHLIDTEADVILTPHYYSKWLERNAITHGFYNSGFVLARTRAFHDWWRQAFVSQPDRFVDQAVLDEVQQHFQVLHLDERANIGHWRRPDRWVMPELSTDSMFLHLHLYQETRLDVEHELAQKTFALSAVEFLQRSEIREHRQIAFEIIARDGSNYYDTFLERRVVVVTCCEPRRALRALLMAESVPTQIPVYCMVSDVEHSAARITPHIVPSNLVFDSVSASGGLDYARLRCRFPAVEWVFFVDIDYIFSQGFWYRFSRHIAREPGVIYSPVHFSDGEARYVRGDACGDILTTEGPETHRVPLTWMNLGLARPVLSRLYLGNHLERRSAGSSRMDGLRDDTSALPSGLMYFGDNPPLWEKLDWSIVIVPDVFLFHLWHPRDAESEMVGLQWPGRSAKGFVIV